MRQHVHKELSAYIDGEARHPERIAEHLQQCESCAREYRQLLALSRAISVLPAPEVRPEFATRVMAYVREAAPIPARITQPWLSVGLALTAITVIVGGAWLAQAPLHTTPAVDNTRAPITKSFSTAANPTATDNAWMDSAWLLEDAAAADWPTETMEPLAEDEWTTPLIEAWGPNEDIDSMLLELDEEAEANFRALLWLYAQDTGAI